MWIALGVIGAATMINLVMLLFVLLRLREAEMFLIVMSGAFMGRETNAEIVAYLKSRTDHPAGKKRSGGDIRRMDEGGTA